ncbi:MAG: hypothetical protein JG718_13795 [Candidatus Thiothrix moscowensis]|nr:hypothetical protein [Candidatus Thiothrix moscowensis]
MSKVILDASAILAYLLDEPDANKAVYRTIWICRLSVNGQAERFASLP